MCIQKTNVADFPLEKSECCAECCGFLASKIGTDEGKRKSTTLVVRSGLLIYNGHRHHVVAACVSASFFAASYRETSQNASKAVGLCIGGSPLQY